jgi:hypothetical protein
MTGVAVAIRHTFHIQNRNNRSLADSHKNYWRAERKYSGVIKSDLGEGIIFADKDVCSNKNLEENGKNSG